MDLESLDLWYEDEKQKLVDRYEQLIGQKRATPKTEKHFHRRTMLLQQRYERLCHREIDRQKEYMITRPVNRLWVFVRELFSRSFK